MLSDGIAPGNRTGAYLHRDRINHRLRARRTARLAAITSGGAIPEMADYRVVTEGERTFVGTLNEDFAIESQAGNVFQLGNTSWRIRLRPRRRGDRARCPRRAGDRALLAGRSAGPDGGAFGGALGAARRALASTCSESVDEASRPGCRRETGADDWAARQAANYVAAQGAAIGLVPSAAAASCSSGSSTSRAACSS